VCWWRRTGSNSVGIPNQLFLARVNNTDGRDGGRKLSCLNIVDGVVRDLCMEEEWELPLLKCYSK